MIDWLESLDIYMWHITLTFFILREAIFGELDLIFGAVPPLYAADEHSPSYDQQDQSTKGRPYPDRHPDKNNTCLH